MKKALIVLGVLIALPILHFGVIIVASELGGEIVTLHRANEDGSESQVRLWVVDDGTNAYIQHGGADAHWKLQLAVNNVLRVERGGEVLEYEAFLAPEYCELYHRLRAEKYGLSDRIVEIGTGTTAAECVDVVRLVLL